MAGELTPRAGASDALNYLAFGRSLVVIAKVLFKCHALHWLSMICRVTKCGRHSTRTATTREMCRRRPCAPSASGEYDRRCRLHPFCPPVRSPVRPFVRPPLRPSARPPTCSPENPPVYQFDRPSSLASHVGCRPSARPSRCPPVRPPVHQSIHPFAVPPTRPLATQADCRSSARLSARRLVRLFTKSL